MMNEEELCVTTERLRIYAVSDERMRELIEKESDAEMKKAYGEMLDGAIAHPDGRLWYAIWMIVERETECEVGDLCFKGLGSDGSVEIGYGIYDAYQGRGIATEAVCAMTRWALCRKGVLRVEAETEPNNLASQRVLHKAGFIPTGEMGKEGPRFVFSD